VAARTLIIGDIVASGATIIAALDAYTRKHRLERVYILSYAGTGVGARRVASFCAEKSVESTFLYGLAVFGLGENGFDLSFLHPETVARGIYKERAREQFAGRAASAVGWDFGSQAMAPQKYRQLCWVEAEIWGLHDMPCFEIAEEPRNWGDLAHERAAYADRLQAKIPRGDRGAPGNPWLAG
jgi:hypothetical protein